MEDGGSGRRIADGPLLVVAGLLLGAHAALAWSLRAPAISTGHDDAMYLLLGRSLLDLSYRNFWLIGSPPHGQYPPLFPAILAVTGASSSASLTPALALNVVFSVMGLGFMTAIGWRWSRVLALLALAVVAVNPSLVQYAGQVRSEPLFMMLVGGAIWWTGRIGTGTGAGTAGLAIAAALTRTVGITLILAVLGRWLVERRWRRVIPLAAASAVTVGVWLGWSALAPQRLAGQSYWADATFGRAAADQVPGSAGSSGTRDDSTDAGSLPGQAPAAGDEESTNGLVTDLRLIGRRIAANGPRYFTQSLPVTLAVPTVPGTSIDNWLWVALSIVLLALGGREVTRRAPMVVVMLGVYAALLVIWPYVINRFLAPVLPLVVLVMLTGARRLGPANGRLGPAAALSLALFLVATAARADGAAYEAMASCDRSAPLVRPGCFAPHQIGFYQAALAGRELTPPDAVFLTPKMATLYYLTDRRSVDDRFAASLTPAALERYLVARGVTHAILSPVHSDQKKIARLLAPTCRRWSLVRSYDDGATILLERVTGARGAPPGSGACQVIARFGGKRP